jgi:GH15 family glucan-1,4-alpha-glucosidase
MRTNVTAEPADGHRPHVLREYAVLGDGERGAVVGADGQVVWLCVPSWHSDPVFDRLLGGRFGYQIAPTDRWSVWSGAYRPGSLVWCAQWVTGDTLIRCEDALAVPADQHTTVLLRRVVAGDQPARVEIQLTLPGAAAARLERVGPSWVTEWDGRYLRWTGAPGAVVSTADELRLRLVHTIEAHSSHDLVLEVSDRPITTAPPDPESGWQTTHDTWQRWTPDTSDTIAPRDVRHAYAVLQGLTSTSGGMVAAATTSLPERERGSANYDYRYAWIRDQCWVGQGIAAHRDHPLLETAVGFVTERLLADGPNLTPAYTVGGDSVPEEQALGLPGYPGGSDRIGNGVTDQFQLDVFGQALLLFASAAQRGAIEHDTWQAANVAVDAVRLRFTEPDAGVWELDNQRWTHSALACVAGLRAIARHTPAREARDWTDLAGHVLADAERWGVHPRGYWRRAAGDDRIDAALLLPALRGAVPADDRRSIATVHAVRSELAEDGYVYRYRHEGQELGDAEGAFLVCGFLLALAEDQQGRHADALRWFERNRSASGPPGLFAEEYDVRRRQLRGNLPQAFVHGLLIESATRLSQGGRRPR